MQRRALVIAALLAGIIQLQTAQARNYEESPTPDSAWPPVGDWIGFVSWNHPIVNYGWTLFPDGTFVSGRLGRGESGGGAWGTHGTALVLKYSDGFRYAGELHGDAYDGTAYTADGRMFGGFSMRRARKSSNVEESP